MWQVSVTGSFHYRTLEWLRGKCSLFKLLTEALVWCKIIAIRDIKWLLIGDILKDRGNPYFLICWLNYRQRHSEGRRRWDGLTSSMETYPLPASLVAQMVKHLSTMRETWVRSLGREDLLEKETAIHSSTLAWKIPWTDEPDKLQSMRSQRVGHDWATSLNTP